LTNLNIEILIDGASIERLAINRSINASMFQLVNRQLLTAVS